MGGACLCDPVPRAATVIEQTTRPLTVAIQATNLPSNLVACMAGSSATAVRPSARAPLGAGDVLTRAPIAVCGRWRLVGGELLVTSAPATPGVELRLIP